MRILHIIPSLQKGGAERLVCDICTELNTRENTETLLVSLSKNNEYKELTSKLDYQVCDSRVHLSVSGKSIIEVGQLEKLITDFAPDIIHSHLLYAEIVSRQILHPDISYVSHVHDNIPVLKNASIDMLFDKKLLTNFFTKRHLIEKYKTCRNNFIAVSDNTIEYLKRVLPSDLIKNTLVLNNAINFKSFNKADNTRDLSTIRLINIGSFQPKKNQLLFIKTVEELVCKGYAVHGTLLGDGALMPDIKRYVVDKGLQDHITFTGNVENVDDYLFTSNLYLHTATYEPFGLVLIEAMASGLPVVSLNGGGNSNLIKNGYNGFMLQDADPIKFADQIIEIFENESQYQIMRKNAVAFASEFDIARYTDRLLGVYKNILSRNPKPCVA